MRPTSLGNYDKYHHLIQNLKDYGKEKLIFGKGDGLSQYQVVNPQIPECVYF